MTEKVPWEMPALVLPAAEPERLPKGEPTPDDLDRMLKAELKRRVRAAKRLAVETNQRRTT